VKKDREILYVEAREDFAKSLAAHYRDQGHSRVHVVQRIVRADGDSWPVWAITADVIFGSKQADDPK